MPTSRSKKRSTKPIFAVKSVPNSIQTTSTEAFVLRKFLHLLLAVFMLVSLFSGNVRAIMAENEQNTDESAPPQIHQDSSSDTDKDKKDDEDNDSGFKQKIKVIKHVVGGPKKAGDFTIRVSGQGVSNPSFPGSENGTKIWLGAGQYNVTEDTDPNYQVSYSEGCSGTIVKPGTDGEDDLKTLIQNSQDDRDDENTGDQGSEEGNHKTKITCTITNTYKPQATFHFIKVLCPSYQSIAGNAAADNADNSGGNFIFFNNYSTSTPHFPSPYSAKPINPNEIPKECSRAAGWNFLLSTNQPQTLDTQTIGPTDNNGEITAQISDFNSALQQNLNQGAEIWVSEVLQPKVASFGAIRCYKDALNGDNLEFVRLEQNNPPKDVYCIAYNVSNKILYSDLSIVKTVIGDAANAHLVTGISLGDSVNFKIIVTNNGPDTAYNVTATDLLPAGLSYSSSSVSQGSYNNISGIWNVGALANGDSATLILRTQLNEKASCKVTNMASVDSGGSLDENMQNNYDNAVVTLASNPNGRCDADLQVKKTFVADDPNSQVLENADPGDNANFRIVVQNNGPQTANNIVVKDLLPAGLVYVSHTVSLGSYDPNTGDWQVGTLANGDSAILIIRTKVGQKPPCKIVNTASITASDANDSNTQNNSSSATVSVESNCGGNPTGTIIVKKIVRGTDFDVPTKFNFTTGGTGYDAFRLANGEQNSQNLAPGKYTLTEQTPQGWILASQNCVYDGQSVGNVVDQTEHLTLDAGDVITCTFINTRINFCPENFDGQCDADLVVTKTVGKNQKQITANPNDFVTFTINVFNNGPFVATGVQLKDLLPIGLNYSSFLASQGSYNPSTGVWNVGTVLNSASATLTLTAQVDNQASGTITNKAGVDKQDLSDPNPDNNSDNANVSVTNNGGGCEGKCSNAKKADVSVDKSVNNPSPQQLNDQVIYTLKVNNKGVDAATNVQLSDKLPASLTYVSSTTTNGSLYDPVTGIWNVGTMLSGTSQTLTIVASVNSNLGVKVTNEATVTASEADPDISNNKSSASITLPGGGSGGCVVNCGGGGSSGGGGGGGTGGAGVGGGGGTSGGGFSTLVPQVLGDSTGVQQPPAGEVLGTSTTLPRTGMPVGDTFLILAAVGFLFNRKLRLV